MYYREQKMKLRRFNLAFLCLALFLLTCDADVEVKVFKTKAKKKGQVLFKARCVYTVSEKIPAATFTISLDTDITKFKSRQVSVLSGSTSGSEFYCENAKPIKPAKFTVTFQGLYVGDAAVPPTGTCSDLVLPTSSSSTVSTTSTSTATTTPTLTTTQIAGELGVEVQVQNYWRDGDDVRFNGKCEFTASQAFAINEFKVKVTFSSATSNYEDWSWNEVAADNDGQWYERSNKHPISGGTVIFDFQVSAPGSVPPSGRCYAMGVNPTATPTGSTATPTGSTATRESSTEMTTTPLTTKVPVTSTSISTTPSGNLGVQVQVSNYGPDGDGGRFNGKCEFKVDQTFAINEFKVKVIFSSVTNNYEDWSWDEVAEADNGQWYERSNKYPITCDTVIFEFQVSAPGSVPPSGRCYALGVNPTTTPSGSTATRESTTKMTTTPLTTKVPVTSTSIFTTPSGNLGVQVQVSNYGPDGDGGRFNGKCEFKVDQTFAINEFKVKVIFSSVTNNYEDWSWNEVAEDDNGHWYERSNKYPITCDTVIFEFQVSAPGSVPPSGRCYALGVNPTTTPSGSTPTRESTTKITTTPLTTKVPVTSTSISTTPSGNLGVQVQVSNYGPDGDGGRFNGKCEFKVDQTFAINEFKVKVIFSSVTNNYEDWSWNEVAEDDNGQWYERSNKYQITCDTVIFEFQVSAPGSVPPSGRCYALGVNPTATPSGSTPTRESTTKMTTTPLTTKVPVTSTSISTTLSGNLGVQVQVSNYGPDGGGGRFNGKCEFKVDQTFAINEFKVKVIFSSVTNNYEDWSWNEVAEDDNGQWYERSNKYQITCDTVIFEFQVSAPGSVPPSGRCYALGVNPTATPSGSTPTRESTTKMTTTPLTTKVPVTSTSISTTPSGQLGVQVQVSNYGPDGDGGRFNGKCEFKVDQTFAINEFKVKVIFSSVTNNYEDWSWNEVAEDDNGHWYERSNKYQITCDTVIFEFQVSAPGSVPPSGRCYALGVNPTTTPSGSTPTRESTTKMTTTPLTTKVPVTSTSISTTPSGQLGVQVQVSNYGPDGDGGRFNGKCEFKVDQTFANNEFKVKVIFSSVTNNYEDWSWNEVAEDDNGQWYERSNKYPITCDTVIFEFQVSAPGSVPPSGRCYALGVNPTTTPSGSTPTRESTTKITTTPLTTKIPVTSTSISTTTSGQLGVQVQVSNYGPDGDDSRFNGKCEFKVSQTFAINEFKVKVNFSSVTNSYEDWSWNEVAEADNDQWYERSNKHPITCDTVIFEFQVSAPGSEPPSGRCYAMAA